MSRTSPPTNRDRDLARVRNLAALSAALEAFKLLPGVDAVVVLVEWVGIKTALPLLLELKDTLAEGRLSWRTPVELPLRGNWFALIIRAFGGPSATAAVLADAGTDAAALALPPPLDGFDVPPMLVDGFLAAMAHRELRRGREAQGGPMVLPGAVEQPEG